MKTEMTQGITRKLQNGMFTSPLKCPRTNQTSVCLHVTSPPQLSLSLLRFLLPRGSNNLLCSFFPLEQALSFSLLFLLLLKLLTLDFTFFFQIFFI